MSGIIQDARLLPEVLQGDIRIYGLQNKQFTNRFFVVTGPGSRELLRSPEVIGFPCYSALLEETAAALRYLFPNGPGGGLDILTILRGGLNYPLEEACARVGIRVRDMHFVSCERIIRDHAILGLDIKYEKLSPSADRILAIGDIIASGATMQMCLDYVVKEFKRQGGSIRRIVFFTIGGTRAIELMEEMTPRIRSLFPGFEGFDCFFYEGVFTVYDGPGASGINVRDIDFGWKGGAVAPEFRSYVLDTPDSLLEKCIIYDGGARRYEIQLHLEEVSEYWEGILSRASVIDPVALVGEKLGYPAPLDFPAWQAVTHIVETGWKGLWEREQELLRRAPDLDLASIARRRLEAVEALKQLYI